MNVFESQIAHYTKKYNGLMQNAKGVNLKAVAEKTGYNFDNLEKDFKENNALFRGYAFQVANRMTIGGISCTTYAAAVSYIADTLGISDYKVYSGFCMKNDHPNYAKEKEAFEKARANGKEHPTLATHVYVEALGNCYEFFSGATENITHFDVVQIK